LTLQLKSEALNFIKSEESNAKVKQINNYLQQFAIIKEFEDFGLFFDDEICKLNKIYELQEIVNAVQEVIELI